MRKMGGKGGEKERSEVERKHQIHRRKAGTEPCAQSP